MVVRTVKPYHGEWGGDLLGTYCLLHSWVTDPWANHAWCAISVKWPTAELYQQAIRDRVASEIVKLEARGMRIASTWFGVVPSPMYINTPHMFRGRIWYIESDGYVRHVVVYGTFQGKINAVISGMSKKARQGDKPFNS